MLAPLFWMHGELPDGKHVGRAHENAELYQRVLPVMHYGFGRLRSGELPLWNAEQHCGAPFHADPLNGLFQPLNAVFLHRDTAEAMALHGFLSLFLMGLFFTVFARALGVRYVSALVGGVAYAFNGASAAAMSRPELASALVWFPLVCWGAREYARDWRPGKAVLGGVALGLMALSGSAPLAGALGLFALLYFLLQLVRPGEEERAGPLRRVSGLLILAAAGAGVAAVQWLPAWFWLRALDNPAAALFRLDLAGQWPSRLGEAPAQLLRAGTDVLPHIGYMGVAALLVAPASLFHRRAQTDALFFLLAGCGLFAGAIAGADVWPEALPWTALAFPAAFSFSAVAALGADRLFYAGRGARSLFGWLAPLLAVAAAAGLFYVGSPEVRGRVAVLVLVLLPFLLFRRAWLGALCGALFAAVLFVDLYAAGANYYRHPYADAAPLPGLRDNVARLVEEQALGGRVLVSTHPLDTTLSPNLGMTTPLHAAGGARLPLTREQAAWWKTVNGTDVPAVGGHTALSPHATHPHLLNSLAARVVLTGHDHALNPARWRDSGIDIEMLRVEEDMTVYKNKSALPRVFWVPSWELAAGAESALAALSRPDFDWRGVCVVEAGDQARKYLDAVVPAAGALVDPPEGGVQGECAITLDRSEEVVIKVASGAPGIAVLLDSYESGWTATVDGASVPILKVNSRFRGVALPAGEHTVRFTYRPLAFWAGLAVSLATLGLLVFGALVQLFRRRTRPVTSR